MLTAQDIKNLTEYLKEIFVTKVAFDEAMAEMKENFSKLQSSVDRSLKTIENHDKELIISNYRASRAEEWIHKASPKIGIEFKN